MKRLLTLLLILTLCCSLAGCKYARDPDLLMLDGILAVSQEQLDRELIGKTRQQILDNWGQPSGSLTDGKGDIYLIPLSDQAIVVHYGKDNIVTSVEIIQQNK